MRKVLMTASVYSHIGNFHLPYLREFQNLGWETHVGCAGILPGTPFVDRAINLPFEKRIFSSANFRAMHILRRTILNENYDLIITHTTLAAFFTRLAVKGMQRRPKLVTVMHGYLFDENTGFLKRAILLNAERSVKPQTDLLLTMNEWDFNAARKYRLCDRIEMLPGIGVNYARLETSSLEDGAKIRKKLRLPDNAVVMLCAAEFSRRKSQRVLIEAMRYLPEEMILVLCGDGACLPGCIALAKKQNVSHRVLFPGYIADIGPWFRMADLYVSASRSEGLPHSVLEAMYVGLPVVASAVKGHIDLLNTGAQGLLYPYGDAEKCADCMRYASQKWSRETQIASPSSERYSLAAVLPPVMEQYLSCVEADSKEALR